MAYKAITSRGMIPNFAQAADTHAEYITAEGTLNPNMEVEVKSTTVTVNAGVIYTTSMVCMETKAEEAKEKKY